VQGADVRHNVHPEEAGDSERPATRAPRV